MASTIEERVVEMKFDNQEFERNVQTSISTLDKLKLALDLDGAAKGFNKISEAADKVDLSNIEKSADAVSVKFDAMQIAGMTAISELTKAFMNFGKRIWDISFGQMKSGGMARALKIEQATFQLRALAKNIDGVNDNIDAFVQKMSDAASAAVQGTAYGYDSAMAVVSQLVASGMKDAEQMEGYLKGIAGAAAMTGRSFDDIGHIFTTIASNGKLMTMQLRQFSASGLNISAELARQMGKTEEQINQMVTKGEISFEQFADALNKAFGDSAQEADKTYSGVLTNVKAALSRIGQLFAEPYIQNMVPVLQKLKAALNQLNAALKPVAKRVSELMKWFSDKASAALESVDFSRLDYFLRGIENLFWSIAMVIEAVRRGFEEMFPPKTQEELEEIAKTFEAFTENLVPTRQALDGITGIVKALLVPVKIVIKLAKAIVKAALPIIVMMAKIVYAVISLIGHIGGIAGALGEVIEESKIFDSIMQIIATTIGVVIVIVMQFITLLADLADMLAASGVGKRFVETIRDVVSAINRALVAALAVILEVVTKIFQHINLENIVAGITMVAKALEFVAYFIEFIALSALNAIQIISNSDTILGNLFKSIKDIFAIVKAFFTGDSTEDKVESLKNTLRGLKDELSAIGDTIAQKLSELKGQDVIIFAFSVAIIALVASLVVLFKNLGDLVYKTSNLVGTFGSIAATLRSIRKVAEHAKMFLYFGGAIMLITGALYELSKIPKERLYPAAIVLGVMATALVAFAVAMVFVSRQMKIAYKEGFSIKSVAILMASLGAAILAMAYSIKLLSDMDMDLEKALKSIGILTAVLLALGGVVIAITQLGAPAALSGAGLGFIGFAAAVYMLVNSLKTIQQINLANCVDNVKALGLIILAVGGAIALTAKATVGSALAILAYALMLETVVKAFSTLANMDIETIKAGLANVYEIFEDFIPIVVITAIISRIVGGTAFAGMGGVIIAMIGYILVSITAISALAKFNDLDKLNQAVDILNKIVGWMTGCIAALILVVGLINNMNGKPADTLIESVKDTTKNGNKIKRTLQKSANVLAGVAAALIAFSISIALLTVPLVALGTIDTDVLIRGGIAIAALMFMVMTTIGGLLAASQFTKDSKVLVVIASLLGMLTIIGGLIAGIVMVSWLYSEEQLDKLLTIGYMMRNILLALAAVFLTLSFLPKGMLMNTNSYRTLEQTQLETLRAGLIMAGLVAAFAIFAKLVIGFMQNYKPEVFGSALTDFAILMGVFGGLLIAISAAVWMLSKIHIEKGQILKTLGMSASLVLVIGAITGFAVAIGLAFKDLTDDQIERIAFAAGMITALFTVIVLIFRIMTGAFKTIAKDSDALFGLVSSGSVEKLDFLKLAGSFGLLIIGILAFAHAVSKISEIGDWKVILLSAGSIAVILGEIATILGFIASSETIKDSDLQHCIEFAAGVVAMSIAIVPIAAAMTMLAGFEWKKLASSGATAFVALLVITGVMAVVLKRMKTAQFKDISGIMAFAAAVAAISSSMIFIAQALAVMSNVGNAISSGIALGIVTGVILAMLAVISAIVTGSTTGGWSSVAAIVAVGVAAAAFGVSMLAVAKALTDMKAAIPNWKEYIVYLGGLLAVLGVLSAVMAAAGLLSAFTGGIGAVGIAAVGVAFAGFGAACYLLGKAVNFLVTGLTGLMNTFKDLGSMTKEDTDRARAAMSELGHGIGDFMQSIAEETKSIKDGVAAVILAVLEGITATLPNLIGIMVASGFLFLINFVVGMFNALPAFLEALERIVHIVYVWAMETKAFYEIGAIIGKAITDGIVGAFEGITGRIQDIIDGTKEEVVASAHDTRDVDILNRDAMHINVLSNITSKLPGPLKALTMAAPGGVLNNKDNMLAAASMMAPGGILNGIARDNILGLHFGAALEENYIKHGSKEDIRAAFFGTRDIQKELTDFETSVDSVIARNDDLINSLEALNATGDMTGLDNFFGSLDEYSKDYDNFVASKDNFVDLVNTGAVSYSALPDALQKPLSLANKVSDFLGGGVISELAAAAEQTEQNVLNEIDRMQSQMSAYQQLIYAYQQITTSSSLDEETRTEALLRLRRAMAELSESNGEARRNLDKYIDNIDRSITVTDEFRTARERAFEFNSGDPKFDSLLDITTFSGRNNNNMSGIEFLQQQIGMPTYEEWASYGTESSQNYVEGFEGVLSRYSLSNGGGHGTQGITKLVPKPERFKQIAKESGQEYTDGLKEGVDDTTDVFTDLADQGKDIGNSMIGMLGNVWDQFKDSPAIKEAAESAGQYLNGAISNALGDDFSFNITGFLTLDTSGIKSAQDYMGQAHTWIPGANKEAWEVNGYESAEAYAKALADTMGHKEAKDYLGLEDMVKGAVDGLNESISDATSGLSGYTDAAGAAAKETDTLSDSIKNALDIFSEFNVSLDMTANDVLRNFSSQLVGVTNWSQELQALAGRGVAAPVLEYLADMGPEAYDKVHALYTASASQLSLFNKMYAQKLSLERSTANDIRASFGKNGSVIVDGAEQVAEAATDKIEEVQKQVVATSQIGVNEMEQGVLDAYKLGIEYEYVNGVYIPDAIKSSIQKATPSVAAIFGEMGYQSMEAFKHYMDVEDAITMVEGFQETLKDSIKGSLNIFDEVAEKEDISAQEMLKRMKENVKNVGKWANDLQTLAARGMDEALLNELQALGPQAADKVHAFMKMTDAELRQANSAFAASAELPQYTADRLTKSYAEAGYNTILGFVEGIDPTAAEEVMTALGTYSLAALEKALDINSPSEKTKKDGLYSVEGFCIGIEENLGSVANVAVLMASTFCASLDETLATYYAQKKMFGIQPDDILNATTELPVTDNWQKSSEYVSDPGLKEIEVKVVPTLDNAKVLETVDNFKKMFDVAKFNFMPTIGIAQSATATPSQNRDYSPALKDLATILHQEKDEMTAMRHDISMLQTAMAGMQVTLDGATVGKIMTPYVNQNLGQTYVRDKRRKF